MKVSSKTKWINSKSYTINFIQKIRMTTQLPDHVVIIHYIHAHILIFDGCKCEWNKILIVNK